MKPGMQLGQIHTQRSMVGDSQSHRRHCEVRNDISFSCSKFCSDVRSRALFSVVHRVHINKEQCKCIEKETHTREKLSLKKKLLIIRLCAEGPYYNEIVANAGVSKDKYKELLTSLLKS